jgi:hypothetical protein
MYATVHTITAHLVANRTALGNYLNWRDLPDTVRLPSVFDFDLISAWKRRANRRICLGVTVSHPRRVSRRSPKARRARERKAFDALQRWTQRDCNATAKSLKSQYLLENARRLRPAPQESYCQPSIKRLDVNSRRIDWRRFCVNRLAAQDVV